MVTGAYKAFNRTGFARKARTKHARQKRQVDIGVRWRNCFYNTGAFDWMTGRAALVSGCRAVGKIQRRDQSGVRLDNANVRPCELPYEQVLIFFTSPKSHAEKMQQLFQDSGQT